MCSPFDYFGCMIFTMKQIEEEEQTIYNVFPMRSEIIPKHIRLDTTTLVHLLMTKKQGIKSKYLTKGNLKRNENKIWEFFFRTERKYFHKKYFQKKILMLKNYVFEFRIILHVIYVVIMFQKKTF